MYVLAQTTGQSRTLPGFYIEGNNTRDEDGGAHSEEEESSEEHHRRQSDDDSDEDSEEDSEEDNRRHRLREMKIRVYNHTVEFKRNGVLVVSALASWPS